MNEAEIKERVTEIFKDVLDDDDIELFRETTAADIEDWDSLNHISLIVAIENEFKTKFELTEIKQLRDVGDMLDLILRKIS